MTWAAIKLFMKKAWVWIKEYWHIPLALVYMLVVWLVFRVRSETMTKVIDTAVNSHKQQVDVLNKTHDEEIKRREESLQKYHETVASIEERYTEENKKLTSSKKKVLKKIIEKHHNDVDGLAREISEKFGVTYVPTDNE